MSIRYALPLFALAVSSLLTPAFAGAADYGRVLVVEPGRFLTEDDRLRLASDGVTVLRELGSDRYLVRRERVLSAASARTQRIVARGREVAVRKVGVEQALRSGGGTAELQVLFFDDVAPSDAHDAIVAAGGEPLERPDENSTGRLAIRARLSPPAIETLSDGNLVQIIRYGPSRIVSTNQVAAELSSVPSAREHFGLTGEGVVASVYEISPLQADHVEFGDRASSPAGTPERHATHVAGTIGAAGLREEAKGMAPEATIAGHVVDLDFTDSKRLSFLEDDASVDNNSWSFVIGWNYDSARSLNWEWWGFTEEFGQYSTDTEDLDRLALTVPTLMIYSSGNDNTDTGPNVSPWAHYHGDEDAVWCSSPSGAGNDCPASPCGTRCEAARHPADGPWTSTSLVGALKNGLAVGAVDSSLQLASFSSRGPAVDGRIKPELVAKGVNQFSTVTNNGYGTMGGTSMAAPVVTGVGALLTEQWRNTFHGNPRPEFLKTVMIHGARDIGPVGPDYGYGFGLVDAAVSAEVIASTTDDIRRILTGSVARDQRWRSAIEVAQGETVRLTLGWADPANVAYSVPAIVNDIDLSLIGPDGQVVYPWILDPATPDAPATRGVNELDNVERIDAVLDAPGLWRVEVAGNGVSTTSAQSFILFSSHPLADGRIACVDPYEPNETMGAASGGLPDDRLIRASLCGSADRDFFEFTLTGTGTIVTTVTGEVPLRVSVMIGGTVIGSVDVAAGETRELRTVVGSVPGGAVQTIVRVEPLSDAEGEYLLRVDWPGGAPALRRGVRR